MRHAMSALYYIHMPDTHTLPLTVQSEGLASKIEIQL